MNRRSEWVMWIRKLLSSKRFFYALLAITILQGVWYATTFVPWVNDEQKHFRTTQIYTEQVTPFFTEQPQAWDDAGQVTRGGSYLFYYAFSWPLRVVELITNDTAIQLIVLRMLMIGFFVAGLLVYRKALLLIPKVSPALVHSALLLFVLTPTAGLLAGMYNYDNVAFLLFGLLLLMSIKVLYTKTVQAKLLIQIAILSGLLILIKWSAAALVLPLFAVLGCDQVSQHGKQYIRRFILSLRQLKRATLLLLVAGLAVVTLLIAERPVQNVIVYKNAEPKCDMVLNHERCMAFADYANYHATLQAKSPDFSALPLPVYWVRYWVPHMADKAANLIEQGGSSRLKVVAALYLAGAVLAMTLLAARWRSIAKNKGMVLLLVVTIGYAAVLIFQEYGVYRQYGIPGAIRTRYLVPVLPLLFCLVLYVMWPLLRRYRTAAASTGIVVLLLLTQGGSVVTHLFTTPPYAYWSPSIFELNQSVKKALDPIVYN